MEDFSRMRVSIPRPSDDDNAGVQYQVIADARSTAQMEQEFSRLMEGGDTAAKPATAAVGASKTGNPEFDALMAPEAKDPAAAVTIPAGGETAAVPPQASETGADGLDAVPGLTGMASSLAKLLIGVSKDGAKGLTEAPAQSVGGVIDAVGEMDQAMQELIPIGGAQLFNDKGEFDPSLISHDQMQIAEKAGNDLFAMVAPDKADTITGGFVRSTAQFLTAFLPASRAVAGLKTMRGGFVMAETAAGAFADMVAFDPDEDRLSTWLNQVPALAGIVPDYLADTSSENGATWENRMKNAIEGAGLGLFTGGLLGAFKYYKAQRTAKALNTTPEPVGAAVDAAKDALKASSREELVQDVPDEALRGLGDSNAPLLVEAPETETAKEAFTRLDAARVRAAKSDKDLAALNQVNAIREKFAAKAAAVDRDPMDEMLDSLRSNAPLNAKIPKRPVAEIVKSLGGVDPNSSLAGDLRSRGITAKAFPGLFRKEGRGALDNIPASEHDIFNSRNLQGDDGNIPQQAFIDGLEAELKGDAWRTPENQQVFDDLISPLDDLEQHLDSLGINYSNMGNQAIKDRLTQIADEETAFKISQEEPGLFASPRTADDLAAEDALKAPESVDGVAVPPKNKIYINTARVNSAEDVRQLLQEMADLDAKNITDKTRGVVSNEQTIKESSQEYRDINDLIGRPPGPMNAAKATAARRLLASSGEQLIQLAKKAESPGATPADLYAFRRSMAVHYAIQSEVVAARTETARALQAWSIPIGATKARSQAIAELIQQGGGADGIQTTAKLIAGMADNPVGMNTIVKETGRAKFGKALYQVWINGLLSSPKTHAANMLSNSVVALWSVPERYMAAGVSKAFYAGEIDAGEATSLAFGMMKGVRDGIRVAWLGKRAAEKSDLADVAGAFVRNESEHPNAISAEAFGLDPAGGFGWGVDMMSKIINVPGSALGKEDEFFKTMGYRMELNAQAHRIASSEGLTGKAHAERMQDVLSNPPENIKAEALDIAHYNTFTNALGAGARQALGGIAKTPYLGTAFKVVMPFVKTPTNILKYTFARTPLAYMAGSVQADIKAGGARAAQAHARVALGSMLMMTVYDMTSEGTFTGRGPEDKQQRAMWMKNNQPYSVRFNGRFYAYNRMDPIGMMIGLGADTAEILANAHQDDSEQLLAAVVTSLANNLSSKTYMNGVFSFMAAADPNNPMSDMGDYIANQASGLVPYSSFLRNAQSAVDPMARDGRNVVYDETDMEVDETATYLDGLISKIRKGIPGLSDELPLMRDIWGEPITKASGIGWAWDAVSPIASRADDPDPAIQVMIDNKIEVSFPPRMVNGVKLTADQYSDFSEDAGRMAKESVFDLINSAGFDKLSDGPDGMKAEMIKDRINSSREYAKGLLERKYPELRERAFFAQQQRFKSLTGN